MKCKVCDKEITKKEIYTDFYYCNKCNVNFPLSDTEDLSQPNPVYSIRDSSPTTLCIDLDTMDKKKLKLEIIIKGKKFLFTNDQILKFLEYIQRGFDE